MIEVPTHSSPYVSHQSVRIKTKRKGTWRWKTTTIKGILSIWIFDGDGYTFAIIFFSLLT